MSQKISIQGQQASYHDIARKQYFKNGEEIIPRDAFKDVFADVKSGEANYGVVAIENSLYGSINQVYDLLLKSECFIVGEIYLRINHCLIGLPEAELKDIQSVYSQREAIAQCEQWLDSNLPQADVHATHDTAASVELVKNDADKTQAAIASEAAAELHELKILEKGIETNHQNYTRFIVITKEQHVSDDANKSSIILTAADKPGSLYEVLGMFNDRSINLTKLESRPIVGKLWEYMFYLDFESAIENPQTKELLSDLQEQGHDVHVLGSYKKGITPKS